MTVLPWTAGIGAYDPSTGVVIAHTISPDNDCRVGPTPIVTQRQGLRTLDTPRPLRHGMVARRPDLLSTLQVTVPVTIFIEGDKEAAEAALDTLEGAWAPRTNPAWLYVSDPAGNTYAYYGKPRDATQPDESKVRSGLITLSLMFEATDPFKFSQDVNEADTDGGTVGPGLGFPFGFPFGFGTSAGPGTFTVTNAGNAITWPLLALVNTDDHPVGPWTVRINALGLSFKYDAKIPAGQQVLVDMSEGNVLLISQAFENYDAPLLPAPTGLRVSSNVARPGSDWLYLPPGDSTIDTAIGGGQGTVAVFWRDCSLR